MNAVKQVVNVWHVSGTSTIYRDTFCRMLIKNSDDTIDVIREQKSIYVNENVEKFNIVFDIWNRYKRPHRLIIANRSWLYVYQRDIQDARTKWCEKSEDAYGVKTQINCDICGSYCTLPTGELAQDKFRHLIGQAFDVCGLHNDAILPPCETLVLIHRCQSKI